MPPQIRMLKSSLPQIMYLDQTESFLFNFNFIGVPWPNVTFFFNNKTFLSDSNPNSSYAFLNITNLTIDNEGYYYARVMNR